MMSNSRVVSFAQLKNGCGKSTLAVNTAVAAQQAGLRVCIYDVDPQGCSTAWAHQRLTTGHPEVVVYLIDKGPLFDLPELRDHGYDLIVVDTPSSDAETMDACIQASDVVYIPFKPSLKSKKRLDAMAQYLNLHPEVRTHILLNRVNTEKIKGEELHHEWAQLIKNESVMEHNQLLDLFLSRRQIYRESLKSGESVMEISPDDNASEEIHQLLENIFQDVSTLAAAKPNSSNMKGHGLTITPDIKTSEMLGVLYNHSLLGAKSKREFAKLAVEKAVKERMEYVKKMGLL